MRGIRAANPAAILKRALSLAAETADERAERENTGSAGIDRIRSPYYHRLNIYRDVREMRGDRGDSRERVERADGRKERETEINAPAI